MTSPAFFFCCKTHEIYYDGSSELFKTPGIMLLCNCSIAKIRNLTRNTVRGFNIFDIIVSYTKQYRYHQRIIDSFGLVRLLF